MKKSLLIVLLLLMTIACSLCFASCDTDFLKFNKDENTDEETSADDHTHTFSLWETTVQPSCTTSGTQSRTCTSCGFAEHSSIAEWGHTEVIDAAVDATCSAEGKTEGKHCSICKAVTVEQTVVPAPGHTEVVDAAIPATCTADGKTQGKSCAICKTKLVSQTIIKALGHSWKNWATLIEAEFQKAGSEMRTCTICQETETREIPALTEDTTKTWFLNQYNFAKKQYKSALEFEIDTKKAEIEKLEEDKIALNTRYQKEIKAIQLEYHNYPGLLDTALKNAENKYKKSLKDYTDQISALKSEIDTIQKEISRPDVDIILAIVTENSNITSLETYEYYYKYSSYIS